MAEHKQNILDLFPAHDDGFLTTPEEERALMEHTANMGFGEFGETSLNSRKNIRIVDVDGYTLKEEDYLYFREHGMFIHIDGDVLADIPARILEENKNAYVKIAIINIDDDFADCIKNVARQDPDIVLAGICDDKTENGDLVLEKMHQMAETGHFCFIAHASSSKIKDKAYSRFNN